MSELFYIQNRGCCGNCAFWWRPGGGGYTCGLDDAGKYTRKEAEAICNMRPAMDKMWPVGEIDALAKRHVDGNVLMLMQRERGAR